MVAEERSQMKVAKANEIYVHDGKFSTYKVWKLRTLAALNMKNLRDVVLGNALALPTEPTALGDGANATERKNYKEAKDAYDKAYEKRIDDQSKAHAPYHYGSE